MIWIKYKTFFQIAVYSFIFYFYFLPLVQQQNDVMWRFGVHVHVDFWLLFCSQTVKLLDEGNWRGNVCSSTQDLNGLSIERQLCCTLLKYSHLPEIMNFSYY